MEGILRPWLTSKELTANDVKVEYSRSLQQFLLDLVTFLVLEVKDECDNNVKSVVALSESGCTR